jgi:predicted acylesterase/phospholipase RssA
MSLGTRFTFHQILFNAMYCAMYCDLSKFPVARACAASSAVPGVLTPLTLKNKYPPAEPEVLRLLAPQRGLIAIG